jgi:hypothetical protein
VRIALERGVEQRIEDIGHGTIMGREPVNGPGNAKSITPSPSATVEAMG